MSCSLARPLNGLVGDARRLWNSRVRYTLRMKHSENPKFVAWPDRLADAASGWRKKEGAAATVGRMATD